MDRLILNPRWPDADLNKFAELISHYPDHKKLIWIATSGSSAGTLAEIKLVGLGEEALRASAQSVNRHLQSDARDVWGQVLPRFHVGGLGIEVRASLSGARIVSCLTDDEIWDVQTYVSKLSQQKVTLTALVPTQIYDLVQSNCESPTSLRAVVVGGGSLDRDLYQKARRLNWPLLPSYGMTETCSQIATAPLESLLSSEPPRMKILDHIETQITSDQRLKIKSPALLDTYAFWHQGRPTFVDPKIQGWFEGEDQVEIQEGFIEIKGRLGEVVKIGGENVSLPRIREILRKVLLQNPELRIAPTQIEVLDFPDSRLGAVLKWVVEEKISTAQLQMLESKITQDLLPFERPRATISVATIPRTALGKTRFEELRKLAL